jgi:hypothetical protein
LVGFFFNFLCFPLLRALLASVLFA